jgi:hypothetical protein
MIELQQLRFCNKFGGISLPENLAQMAASDKNLDAAIQANFSGSV